MKAIWLIHTLETSYPTIIWQINSHDYLSLQRIISTGYKPFAGTPNTDETNINQNKQLMAAIKEKRRKKLALCTGLELHKRLF